MLFDSNSRFEYWKDALNIIADHPFQGTGLNTYTAVIKEYAADKKDWNYPHNSYLQVASEVGLTGLGLLLAIFWSAFSSAARGLPQVPAGFSRDVLCVLVGGFVGLLVQSGAGAFDLR